MAATGTTCSLARRVWCVALLSTLCIGYFVVNLTTGLARAQADIRSSNTVTAVACALVAYHELTGDWPLQVRELTSGAVIEVRSIGAVHRLVVVTTGDVLGAIDETALRDCALDIVPLLHTSNSVERYSACDVPDSWVPVRYLGRTRGERIATAEQAARRIVLAGFQRADGNQPGP